MNYSFKHLRGFIQMLFSDFVDYANQAYTNSTVQNRFWINACSKTFNLILYSFKGC